MARHTGKNLVVMVENASSTEVALTNVISATTPDQPYASVEFIGDDVKSSGAGQLSGWVDIEFEFDDTATTGNHAVLTGIQGDNAAPKFVRVRPVGTGEGLIQYSVDAVCLGPSYATSRDGKVVGKVRFENHKEASADPAWAAQSA